MKKLLLLFLLFFATSNLMAQFTQPSQFNYTCDDDSDGFAFFYLGEITAEIVGNLNYLDYTITHHATQADAQTGANPLSGNYFNTVPFTQTIYARIVTNANGQVDIMVYQLYASPAPIIQTMQTLTTCIGQCANLESLIPFIINGDPMLFVTFHETQMDAVNGANPIFNTTCYNSIIAGNQSLFYRVENYNTGCFSLGELYLIVTDCGTCPAPFQVNVSQVSADHAFVEWQSSPGATYWTLELSQNGSPAQTITSTQSYYLLTNLVCDAAYTVTITGNCDIGPSIPVGPYSFMTTSCVPTGGQPADLQMCSDTGIACFDLTANTPLILNSLSPSQYTVTYHLNNADANAGVSAIANPAIFCTNSYQLLYSRLENIATHDFTLGVFSVNINIVSNQVVTLSSMDQCDDNNDSTVIFDLTTIQAQISSGGSLSYYTSLADAQSQTTPIANPTSYSINVQTPVTSIFVRENISNDCDVIYTFMARTYSVCNLAFTCSSANSLCNALGVPFANTHQATSAEAGNYYGCLNTQPNPTWFYLPVSGNGTINLQIEQNSSIGFNANALDVDYIVYGPFANPVTPCSGQLTQSTMVSCSYSANAVEYPIISNAQAGQYYIIMVTNFANQAGYIRITELSNTVGAIDCSGLRLNAFLDNNNNGIQDTGEQNFPLGQFTYEVNANGNVHNITSPSGIYNIYDANSSNSYNLNYVVDANYAALYNVSPASFTNIHTGIGMAVYNFPVTVAQPYIDLAVHITPLTAPRPGFIYQNIVNYTNNGSQTMSGTLTFTKDALVTITLNTQGGTTPTATGFTYNFTNLLPFETRSMIVTMQVPTIPTVQINGLLTNTASVAPTAGDVVLPNNSSSNTQIIVGSYDPNDKMESHGEKILHATFTSDDYLYYTIRFENTGTASAINIRVNDILDAQLDENSIKMISASHPYVLDRVDATLNWKFENIQLPPSVANSNTGKGYVTFKVKPKSGYAVGDIIPNTAAIYFDFNPAIVTNTFNTEFVQQLGVGEFENTDFVFYPNPASANVTISVKNEDSIAKIAVYDITGKMIISEKPSTLLSTQTVNLSAISKGMYLLEVTTDTNIQVVKKLLIQ